MRQKLSELSLFFREFRRNFHDTGAIAPSGRSLARALTRYVRDDSHTGTRRILEVGPGTGAVTRKIVASLGDDDYFDLVELNQAFVDALRQRFKTDPAFSAVADRCRVIHDRIEQLPLGPTYDLIVSGLPLNNFASDDVETVLNAFAALLKPGGTLSFFEYVAVRPMRSLVSRKAERRRLKEVGRLLNELFAGKRIRRDCVLANVPPAWAHHVRFPAESLSACSTGENVSED